MEGAQQTTVIITIVMELSHSLSFWDTINLDLKVWIHLKQLFTLIHVYWALISTYFVSATLPNIFLSRKDGSQGLYL